MQISGPCTRREKELVSLRTEVKVDFLPGRVLVKVRVKDKKKNERVNIKH